MSPRMTSRMVLMATSHCGPLGVSARPSTLAPRARDGNGLRRRSGHGACRRGDVRRASAEGEQVGGIGQDLADVAQEERRRLPVDQPVVEGQAQGHDVAQGHLALELPGPPLHGAEGEDGGLARVEDGHAGVHAEDADVGEGDGAAAQVVGVQRAARARAGQLAPARAVSSRRVRSCASLMFGTTRPRGPATAMPRLT